MEAHLEDFIRTLNNAILSLHPSSLFDQHLLAYRRNKSGGVRKRDVLVNRWTKRMLKEEEHREQISTKFDS